jgi:hypothetical protein
VKKSEKKRKKRLEFRFPLFRCEAKITKSKRSEKFKAKKAKKNEKSEKIDLIFASLWFASKRKLLK